MHALMVFNSSRPGFDAYLVGGCVRDLLLKKTPKDFDVVTTAGLKQVFARTKKLCWLVVSETSKRHSNPCCLIYIVPLQVKKQFNRCQIVGQRFPICRVTIYGNIIEVCIPVLKTALNPFFLLTMRCYNWKQNTSIYLFFFLFTLLIFLLTSPI